MLRRIAAAALCLFQVQMAWSLDADAQKLADRYESILAANPSNETAFERLWRIHEAAGESRELAKRARERTATQPVLSARILERAGNGEEAIGILEPVAGDNAAAANVLSQWLERAGQYAKAAEILERAGVKTADATLLLRAGEIRWRAGEGEKSRAAWGKAAEMAPHDMALREKLAQASASGGDISEALIHWQAIIAEGSPMARVTAREESVLLLEQAGKFNEAIECQEALINMLGPSNWKLAAAEERLIALYQRSGRTAELESRWQREANEQPQDVEAARRMARYYKTFADDSRRMEWLKKVSSLAPDDRQALREKLELEIAAGQLDEALVTSKELTKAAPGDDDALFWQAEIAVLAGREKEAELLVNDFLSKHKNDDAAQTRAREFFSRMRLTGALEEHLVSDVKEAPDQAGPTVALAQFQLEERQFQRATETFSRFDISRLPDKQASADAQQFAAILRNSLMEKEALQWLEKALAREPDSLEAALASAEILSALDRKSEGGKVLATAATASLGTLPPEELDKRFFTALKNSQDPADPLKPDQSDPAIRRIIAALQSKALESRTGADWLRLSRWRQWNGENVAAEESLRRGLSYHQNSKLLIEEMAKHHSANGDLDDAIVELHKLAQLEPERTHELQRRIGLMELNRGRAEEALRIFQMLHQANPRDWQTSADLATAQQAGENWFAAMERWFEAYTLAPAEAKRGLRQPLLASAARLQLHKRALDFLEQSCATENNPRERMELFQEAAAFVIEQKLEKEWKERLQGRVEAPNAPVYWKTGLAAVLKEEGQPESAQKLLTEGLSAESSSASLLAASLAKAEEEGNFDAAATLSLQLARLSGGSDSEPWIRHAELLEHSGQSSASEKAWRDIARRFSRDRTALAGIAGFFSRRQNEAEAEKYLRQMATLGASSPQDLLKLSRLAQARHDRDQATRNLEELLATTRPDLKSILPVLPFPTGVEPPNRANGSDPWPVPSEAETEGCRLAAIRELGQMLTNSPTRRKWADSFTHPIERIWAWHSSGEIGQALNEGSVLASLETTSSAFKENFAATAIEEGREKLLTNWASVDIVKTSERWRFIVAGMTFLLDQGWRPKEATLSGLVAGAPAISRWDICTQLASHGYPSLACRLGRDVPARLPRSMAAQTWIEYANWCIARRDIGKSIEALDKALQVSQANMSYAEPIFAALRMRWLLTPSEERPAFEEAHLSRLKSLSRTAEKAASAALFATLRGCPDEAKEQLAILFENSDFSSGASWADAIQQGGRILEQWNLHRMARDLYRGYLKYDDALLTLGGENFRRETESFLVQNKLLDASPDSIPYLLSTWKAHGASQEDMLQAARRLAGSGHPKKAEAIITRLCEEMPASDSIAAGILAFSQDRELFPSLREYGKRLLSKPGSPMAKALANNAGLRFAILYQQESDYEQALSLLKTLKKDGPTGTAVALREAQILSDIGRHSDATHSLEQLPPSLRDTPACALMLADLYLQIGKETEARNVLLRQMDAANPSRFTAATKLKELAEMNGDVTALEKANAVLKSSRSGNTLKPPSSEREWQQIFAQLNVQFTSTEERFQAGSQFLATHKNVPESLRRSEVDTLGKLAKQAPILLPRYYILRKNLAQSLNTTKQLEQELLSEWNHGAGNYYAGEILIQLFLEEKRTLALSQLLNEYLTDATFRPLAWRQLASALLALGHVEQAARVLTELRSRSDGDVPLDLMLAEALWKQGKPTEAILSPIQQIALADPARRLDLARHYLALNLTEEAKSELCQIPATAGLGRQTAEAWAALASSLIAQGQLTEAQETLRFMTTRYPGQIRGEMVAAYHEASGEVAALSPDANPYQLRGPSFREWQVSIVEKLEAAANFERIFFWFEKNPAMLADDRIRDVLHHLEKIDRPRVLKALDMAAMQTSLWKIRSEAAQAHLRQAETLAESGATPLTELEAALKFDPGNFAIVKAYVDEALRLRKPAQAQRALQAALKAPGTPADRRAAARMLESLKTSPPLPGGTG